MWMRMGNRAGPMLMPLPHDVARVALYATYIHIRVCFLFRASDLPKSLQSSVLMFHFSQHKSPVEALAAKAAAQVWDFVE